MKRISGGDPSESYLYIFPELYLKAEKEKRSVELSVGIESSSAIKDMKSLLDIDFGIILSEPGNGKSRLLKEIVIQSPQYGCEAIYLDLKRIAKKDIQKGIQEYLNRPNKTPRTNKEINSVYEYFSSERFDIENLGNESVICLDGLDEVSREYQYEVIGNIKSFKSEYPHLKIFVSCRDYIFEKFGSVFTEFNPIEIVIDKLPPYKIIDFLQSGGFSQEEVSQTFNQFYRGFNIELIDNPRILEIFIAIKEKEGLEKVLKKSKSDLLEQFIYGNLNEEDQKQNKNYADIIKRVLEILALTMEIYQSNTITKDELMTFFDDVRSNLTLTFLNQIDLNDFYDRTLLIPTDDTVHFQNAEFQEYLAAKEISRLGKIDQVFYDISVEKNSREIYPAWGNTLKYLIEIYPPLQSTIVEFTLQKERSSSAKMLETIVLENESKISEIPQDQRKHLFESILDYYNKGKKYLPLALAHSLSLYYSDDIDLNQYWARYMKAGNVIAQGNILLAQIQLLERKTLPNAQRWKNIYASIAKNTTANNRLRDLSIRALSEYQDVRLLKKNTNYSNETDSSFKHTIVSSFIKVAPNDLFTIDLIIQSIQDNDLITIPFPNFDHVTAKESFIYIFNKMISERDFLNKYESYSYDRYQLNSFCKNIKDIYDKDIEESISSLLLSEGTYLNHRSFLLHLLLIIKEKNSSYIFHLVNVLKSNGDYLSNWWLYNGLFEHLLTETNTEEFIVGMQGISESSHALVPLFMGLKYSPDPEKRQIFEISEKYFGSLYEAKIKEQESHNRSLDRSQKYYEEFQFLLSPDPDNKDKYKVQLFGFYSSHKESIDKYIQPEEKERLSSLVKSVLKYDFNRATIRISEANSGTTSYQRSNSIPVFGMAMQLFKEFEIPVEEYRKKVVEYIPFQFISDDVKYSFDLISGLNQEDINYLINFYSTLRGDDTIKMTIRNFYEVCKKYHLLEAIPVLKECVFNNGLYFHDRYTALEVIHSLSDDHSFYNLIFAKYNNSSIEEEKSLATKANEFLILSQNAYQEEAIIWRMDEIISNPIAREDEDIDDFIDPDNLPIREHRYLFPLSQINLLEYIPKFLNLLDSSVLLLEKDKLYKPYVLSIWQTILSYFENLKVHNSLQPVLSLEKHILEMNGFEEKDLLLSYLSNVKYNYLHSIGRLTLFSDCIKKYNEIKTRRYLPIITSYDLLELVTIVINEDLQNWIAKEGAYDFSNYGVTRVNTKNVQRKNQYEELIQKTIKTQFENFLMKRGIRDNEVRIQREAQLLSNDRTDFIISYGFTGQILIEIKLTQNIQAYNKKHATAYKNKMIKYVKGTRSDYGIFLVFQIKEKPTWGEIRPMLLDIYKGEPQIKVLGLNCTG